MNDDLVVSKILKLLENNTAFIGYALNGGVGTKINVRNTENGKTIQALSINVDSTGEVLVVKDSADNQYKAVNFKTSEKVSERIIQLRKTKPVDDKKTIEYTDSDIEVFYLFVKLIDTGSPVPTQLESTWIRKGSSCTQFVGAYERCNYASRKTIGGTSYTGLPYQPYTSLESCLADDNGPDAKTPHGTKDESGRNFGWKYFSTKVSASGEERMKAALESHDNYYKTNYKRLFGYGSIIECSGAMNIQGWETVRASPTPAQTAAGEAGTLFTRCEFSFLPGFTLDCTPAMQAAGYCDQRGFISSKCPLFGQQPAGQPSVGNVDNSWGHQYGWVNLPYTFMYKRHFGQLYLNGSTAPGSFYILEVNDDQVPGNLPAGYDPWVPGCPGNAPNGGPYNGSGGGRNPDDAPPIQKRDMKLSTHKAEIWLGSSKKETAIKLYELGASDLFSGMYNAFIIRSDETQVDIENRLKRGFTNTQAEVAGHNKFYENWNKNRIDLNIDPRVWVYVIDNTPQALYQYNFNGFGDPTNESLKVMVDNLYNRTINLSIVDNKTQVVHLKLGLIPKNILNLDDCKSSLNFLGTASDKFSGQSWEYQKYVTITIKDWGIVSTQNILDTTKLDSEAAWNLEYIQRKFFTSFGTFQSYLRRDDPALNLLRQDANISLEKIITDNHFEQYNYSTKYIVNTLSYYDNLYFSGIKAKKYISSNDNFRFYGLSTTSWWELWDKTHYNKKNKRLSSIVGYDKNWYQIVRSSGLGLGLNYFGYTSGGNTAGNAVTPESYMEYLPSLPKKYISSVIKGERTKINPNSPYKYLADRKKTLDQFGVLFYFSTNKTNWALQYPYYRYTDLDLPFISLPDEYYSYGYSYELTTNFPSINNLSGSSFLGYNTRRFYTRSWKNTLWATLIYDTVVKVDVDSYSKVNFNSPTNPSQYKKFAVVPYAIDNEYSFSTLTHGSPIELETVLSPGKLDITKQVPIKKPINVDLDPNMSFLLYIYPFVSVIKKTKVI